MSRGVIEGKNARAYANRKKSKRSKIFDDFILRNVKAGKKIKVCDLCCGHGNTLELLKGRVGEVTGVDASSEMIKICKERIPGVKLVLSSVTNTKLTSNYFDYVIIRNGLHHIKEKEEVIAEIHRILKPKGKLILIDKFYTNLLLCHLTEIFDLLFKFNAHYVNHYIISREATLSLFKNFKILKEVYTEGQNQRGIQAYMAVLEKI